MKDLEFWLVMAMVAIAVGLRFAATKKRWRLARERAARWEAFKEKQRIR